MGSNEVFEELLKDTGYTQVHDDPFAKDGLIVLRDKDGNEKGFDGIELAIEFLYDKAEKSSIMPQAENLINETEKTQIFLGNGERNLIMNYALHTQEIDKTNVLLDKLCMAGFEKEHGFVNPKVETAVNKEIESIDKFGIPEYKLHLDEETKYIILAQKDNTAFLKRIIENPIGDPTPYIVANGIHFKENNLIEWDSGNYCPDFDSGIVEYSYKAEGIEKPLIGEIDFLSSGGKVAYTTKYNDINIFENDIKECLNNGELIEVRDFSKQNIYSNAVADMCGYDEAQIKTNNKDIVKSYIRFKDYENLKKFYPTTAPIIPDNETAVSIFTKMYDDNSAVKYEVEYSPFGFNGQEHMKFMYVDTYKDIYNAYPSIEDVKEFMDIKSYEKFQSNISKIDSWQEKLSHSDKDNDGIPDIIDETYNPPEYFYRYATPEEIEKLKQKDIDFEFKPKKPCDQYLIKHRKSDCDKINSILRQSNSLTR